MRVRCRVGRTPWLVHIERPQRFPDVPLEKLERDTAVERALARDLRAAHGWHFRRDGPAFVLQRDDRTVSVEVLGFYTPEYLRTRLASSGGDLILCVDESLSCADGELPREVLRFSRRIRVTSLLEAVEKVDRRREPG
jgi:predicted nuclease of restriction endonuclease-like RecB superfamily